MYLQIRMRAGNVDLPLYPLAAVREFRLSDSHKGINVKEVP